MDASLTCSVRAGGQANRDETQQHPLGLHNLHPSWVVHSAELFCAPRTPNAFWGALEISHHTNALQCELRSPGHAHCVTSSLGPQVFLPSHLLTLPPSPPIIAGNPKSQREHYSLMPSAPRPDGKHRLPSSLGRTLFPRVGTLTPRSHPAGRTSSYLCTCRFRPTGCDSLPTGVCTRLPSQSMCLLLKNVGVEGSVEGGREMGTCPPCFGARLTGAMSRSRHSHILPRTCSYT